MGLDLPKHTSLTGACLFKAFVPVLTIDVRLPGCETWPLDDASSSRLSLNSFFEKTFIVPIVNYFWFLLIKNCLYYYDSHVVEIR